MLNRFIDALRSGKSETTTNAAPETVEAEEPEVSARTAAVIRAELTALQGATGPLSERCGEAQAELLEAQSHYDAGIQAFVLGERSSEPDRGELAASISKSDALRRIAQETSRRVVRLRSELAAVELAEAIAAGRDRLPALSGSAEARLMEFERAVLAVRAAEGALFAILFDERSGLKQVFPSPELGAEAQRVRHLLRRRAEQIAHGAQYVLHPDFETDGNINLGAEYAVAYQQRNMSLAYANAARQDRLVAAIGEK